MTAPSITPSSWLVTPACAYSKTPGIAAKATASSTACSRPRANGSLFTDADLSSPIGEVEKLWSALEREHAQVAVGSRAVDRSLVGVHQPLLREAVGRVFNAAMRLVTGLPFKDTQCGFKLFQTSAGREVFSRQQLDGFGFDVEVLFIAKTLGLKSVEVPVRWDNVEGTKVSMLLGFVAFMDLLKVRRNAIQGKYR